jgi:hypothetical protein
MLIQLFNAAAQLTLAMVAGWAVMSPRVNDGIFIKIGLVLISIGFMASVLLAMEPQGERALAMAHACVHAGMLICWVGYLWRKVYGKDRRYKRMSDWVDERRPQA